MIKNCIDKFNPEGKNIILVLNLFIYFFGVGGSPLLSSSLPLAFPRGSQDRTQSAWGQVAGEAWWAVLGVRMEVWANWAKCL